MNCIGSSGDRLTGYWTANKLTDANRPSLTDKRAWTKKRLAISFILVNQCFSCVLFLFYCKNTGPHRKHEIHRHETPVPNMASPAELWKQHASMIQTSHEAAAIPTDKIHIQVWADCAAHAVNVRVCPANGPARFHLKKSNLLHYFTILLPRNTPRSWIQSVSQKHRGNSTLQLKIQRQCSMTRIESSPHPVHSPIKPFHSTPHQTPNQHKGPKLFS